MNTDYSQTLYKTACELMPGGVNSPVRAFKGVRGTPIFFKKAQGAYLWDVDGNRYIDYVASWGPAILGHSHPAVLKNIQEQLPHGLSFGAPTELEIAMARCIQRFMPSLEKMRMVSSGTEATLSAIRLARGFTQRPKILKFEGCYHGHSDSLLVKAGSGLLTFGVPGSLGVPPDFAQHTLTAPFNDLAAVEALLEAYGKEVAAIIVEPIPGNMNLVLPKAGFLEGLRALCDRYHTLLIFDEVMTGFRVALGGAQALYGVKPDLTTLGKVVGGGLPVGVFGGRRDIMDVLAPLGSVYQAGTLSGNPIAMAAGLATLSVIEAQKDFYTLLERRTQQLVEGFNTLGKTLGIPFYAQSIGGMFGVYFHEEKTLPNYQTMLTSDVEAFKAFFHGMLQNGIYLAPSAFEAGFVSSAHTEDDIEKTCQAARKVLTR